jgi:hypothetical protein
MREIGMAALDANRDKNATEPSKITAKRSWLCVTVGAVVGVAVIAAVILYVIFPIK